jgi:hypothetical protein
MNLPDAPLSLVWPTGDFNSPDRKLQLRAMNVRRRNSPLKKSLEKSDDKIGCPGHAANRVQDMLGHKAKMLKVHRAICLDDLVPPDNFYRKLEVKLDLTFVRDLVRDQYASRLGRPSIDPMVFIVWCQNSRDRSGV